MTWVAIASVMAVVWAFTVPSQESRLLVLEKSRGPWPKWWWVSVCIIAVAMVLVAAAVFLPGKFLWIAMGSAVAATLVWVFRMHASEKTAANKAAEVARACRIIAAQLQIGQTPADALSVAAEECKILSGCLAAQEIGAQVPHVLQQLGETGGNAGLASFGRAWKLCERSGSPLAPAARRVAETVDSDTRLNAEIAAELAVPRATGRLLACLPLLGIGMGFLAGGNPITFLTASGLGKICLTGAVLLACSGLIWTEMLARHARRDA